MMEVVKVQVWTGPLGKGMPAVICPKDCANAQISIGGKLPDKRIKEQKLDATAQRAMGNDRTGYFKASLVDGKWKLGRRLPDQGW